MQAKIVNYLKSAPGYISGEEISHHCKISRAAIWKYIQELRNQGYDIVAVPHLGYQLISVPDKLFPVEIQHGLKTQILGKKIIYYDSIPSTMDVAFQLGMEGFPEGTVIITESQTKGRGRMGRTWVSPKGKGVYMSIILRPKMFPREVAQLTLMTAVALNEAVKKIADIDSTIKWPNDILVGDRKLAGILTEMSAEMDCVKFAVVGMGLNVNTSVNALPENSTSLKAEAKKNIVRVEVVREILEQSEKWYDILRKDGFSPILKRWKLLSSTLGKRVRIQEANSFVEGEAINVDEFGGLMIRDDNGITIRKMSGDVIKIR